MSIADVILTRRAMDSLGIETGGVPDTDAVSRHASQPEMEVWLGGAYNRWLIERILSGDDRIKSLVYLPFNTPEEAERTVEELGDKKGVIGFCVTSTRNKPVHHNDYIAPLRHDRGSAASRWPFTPAIIGRIPRLRPSTGFSGMHALGFVWCNMVHMTNWVLTGFQKRFPKLKTLWVESGLAWVPFLMQRLDDQYLMRPSEAPRSSACRASTHES